MPIAFTIYVLNFYPCKSIFNADHLNLIATGSVKVCEICCSHKLPL